MHAHSYGVSRSLCLALFRSSSVCDSLAHALSLFLSLSADNIAIVAAVGFVPCAGPLRDDATVRTTRAWTPRTFANGVSALFCIVYLPLGELCDVAAHARARGRPLLSRTKFTRCCISAQDCAHGKYENGHHSCFWYARNGTKNLDNAHACCAAGLRTRWHRLRGRGRNQNHERGRGAPRRPEAASRYPHSCGGSLSHPSPLHHLLSPCPALRISRVTHVMEVGCRWVRSLVRSLSLFGKRGALVEFQGLRFRLYKRKR